jgi:hypothetical protein
VSVSVLVSVDVGIGIGIVFGVGIGNGVDDGELDPLRSGKPWNDSFGRAGCRWVAR